MKPLGQIPWRKVEPWRIQKLYPDRECVVVCPDGVFTGHFARYQGSPWWYLSGGKKVRHAYFDANAPTHFFFIDELEISREPSK